jgi:hypothetical protein
VLFGLLLLFYILTIPVAEAAFFNSYLNHLTCLQQSTIIASSQCRLLFDFIYIYLVDKETLIFLKEAVVTVTTTVIFVGSPIYLLYKRMLFKHDVALISVPLKEI